MGGLSVCADLDLLTILYCYLNQMPRNPKSVYFENHYYCSDQTGKVPSAVRASNLMVHRTQGKHPRHVWKEKAKRCLYLHDGKHQTVQRKVQNIAATPMITPNWRGNVNLISPWQAVYALDQDGVSSPECLLTSSSGYWFSKRQI